MEQLVILRKLPRPVQQAVFALSVPFGLSDYMADDAVVDRQGTAPRCGNCNDYGAFVQGSLDGKVQRRVSWCLQDRKTGISPFSICDDWSTSGG